MKPALIIVDMLEEFVHGRLKSPQAEAIIPTIQNLIKAFKSKNLPVIYVVDSHLLSDIEFKIWGPHALKGTSEAKIIEELKPASEDLVFEKRYYSGFRDTGLDVTLRDLGVDTVVLTGIHTHICVLHTAADAFYLRYNIIVVKDAVAAFSLSDHEYALKYMGQVYGAKLLTSEEVINLLKELKVKK